MIVFWKQKVMEKGKKTQYGHQTASKENYNIECFKEWLDY